MKKYIECVVASNVELNSSLIELKINVGEIADYCKAGQFASIYVNDKSKILPRPISISEIDRENKVLTFVIQIVGEGTKQLAGLKLNDRVSLLLPLGNGYELDEVEGLVYLVGGGVGIPPLVQAYKELKAKGLDVKVILGFRSETFLTDRFEAKDLFICTDDGSTGFKGNVVEQLKALEVPSEIFSCGPKPMLMGVVEYAKEKSIKTQISMEERMACSIGVCLGCVIKVRSGDEVVTKKVCVDGPVFSGEAIVFE